MLAITIPIHKPPTNQGNSSSLLPPHLPSQAQVPSLQSQQWPCITTIVCFLIIWALSNVAGASVRACQSSLVANGKKRVGVNGQEAEGQGQPLSQCFPPIPPCPSPLGTTRAFETQNHPCFTRPNAQTWTALGFRCPAWTPAWYSQTLPQI